MNTDTSYTKHTSLSARHTAPLFLSAVLCILASPSISLAQMKIGDNPTSINPATQLHIEKAGLHTVILDNGNVGIGTVSPGDKLAIGRSDWGYEGAQINMHRASDNTNAYSIDVYGNGSGATDAGYFRIINAKNPSALTPLVIDNNGNVGIGVGSSHPEHRFQIRQSDPSLNAYSLVESNRYAVSSLRSYSNTGGNALQMIRARGSLSAPTAVQSGDWLGYWESIGFDTTSTTQVTSRILSVVNGAVSAGVLPTDMIFFTSPTDSAGLSERMRISSNGNVGIGTASPTNKLTVNGGITSTKWNVTQILNNQVGPLPITSTSFTTNGGTLLIAASGSGYNGGQIGMSIAVDGVIRGYAKTYSNEGASHKAFVPVQLVVTGITAGSHTITLAAWNSTASDGNDFYNITVTELPW